jgi:Gram-negative bacterial TonB protein C-terminal
VNDEGLSTLLTRGWTAAMRVAFRIFIVLLVSPAASHAAEIAIPELGIRFNDTPQPMRPIELTERPTGFEAYAQLSRPTSLTVYRDDYPAPAGSLDDPQYRADLVKKYGGDWSAQGKGAKIRVGGHDAWAVGSARRFGSGGTIIAKELSCLLIVDQRFYRITVWTGGTEGSEEFSAMAKAIEQGTVFEPIKRPELPAYAPDDPPAGPPRFVEAGRIPWYPAIARGRGEQGVVDLQFSINSDGQARQIKKIYQGATHLGDNAVAHLEDGVFRLPPDWQQSGRANRRYVIEFQYSLVVGSSDCPKPKPSTRAPEARIIALCASTPGT